MKTVKKLGRPPTLKKKIGRPPKVPLKVEKVQEPEPIEEPEEDIELQVEDEDEEIEAEVEGETDEEEPKTLYSKMYELIVDEIEAGATIETVIGTMELVKNDVQRAILEPE